MFGEISLQRLFTTFPGGWPGFGLLLLRAVVASAIIFNGVQFLSAWPDLSALIVVSFSFTAGLCLLLGVITPIASLIVAFGTLAYHFLGITNPGGFVVSSFLAFRITALALATACLGPGAFSLDARVFGRRKIHIPPLSFK